MNSFSFVLVLGAIAAASAGIIAPNLVAAPGFLHSAPLVGVNHLAARLVVPAGSGLEGQWIPDINEKLYDDGSYKPELTPLPLSPSPYGLTPSGSGLEGAYVRDNLETLYDDGSYKPTLTPLPLSASPIGLVPSGSGIEGAYVHDHTDKLFDDGSYKPGLYL